VSRLTLEWVMSSWGMFALLRPFTSYLPSPVGSDTVFIGVSPEMSTWGCATNSPLPWFCRTNIPCGAEGSSKLFESA